MSKPLEKRCKMYCSEYPTCNKTSCDRSILFLHGKKTVMADKAITNKLTTKIRKEIWYNSWNTRINTF